MDRTWFVGDSGLFQCGVRALPAVQTVVNETGLMNSFLGMERWAKKCLWSRLKWQNGVLLRSSDGSGIITCKTWLAHWHGGKVTTSEGKPAQVKELNYDEEFRHLEYIAPLWGTSNVAMDALRDVARRMTLDFQSRQSLRDCGASIVQSVLLPKLVYLSACWRTLRQRQRSCSRLNSRTASCFAIRCPVRFFPVGRSHRCNRARRPRSGAAGYWGHQCTAASLSSNGDEPHGR